MLCIEDGLIATKQAKSNYISGVLTDGNGDAFRHAQWNFKMARDVGSSFAKSWSDAHEYGTKNNEGLQLDMDLYNNNVGITLAKGILSNFGTGVTKTKETVRAGKMKIIRNKKLVWSDGIGEK